MSDGINSILDDSGPPDNWPSGEEFYDLLSDIPPFGEGGEILDQIDESALVGIISNTAYDALKTDYTPENFIKINDYTAIIQEVIDRVEDDNNITVDNVIQHLVANKKIADYTTGIKLSKITP